MNFGIFPQAFSVMLTATLIPLVGSWYVYNRQLERTVEEKVEQRLLRNSDRLSTAIDYWTDTNLKLLSQNARLSYTISMDGTQQSPVVQAIADSYDWIYIAFVTDVEGYKISRNQDEGFVPLFNEDGSPTQYRGDREYHQQVINGELYGQQVLSSRSTGKPAWCLAHPVNRNSQLVGVLNTCSELTAISERVIDARIGNTGFAILVDDRGQVIAHGRPELVAEDLVNISDHPAFRTGILDDTFVFEEDGRQVIANVRQVGLGWRLIVQQDRAEAYTPVRQAQRIAIVLLGIGIVTASGFAYGFARFLVRPIEALTRAADEVSRGQLDIEIEGTNRRDEIGSLARSVNRLVTSVKLAISTIKQ